jgi:glutamyl-tRNA synthetase
MFAQKHKGKCVMRFEDTNPAKSAQEFVDSIREDVEWLDIKPNSEVIMSDLMPEFYAVGEKLISEGQAYACFCSGEDMKELRHEGKECVHRNVPAEDNMKVWNDMKDRKYEQGEVIIRLKGDMSSNNGTMRDPVLFRIDYAEHYKYGDDYVVWPLYDMASVVSEEKNGVTHVLRSTEFTLRAELHDYIRKLLGYRNLEIFEFGRFNVRGYSTKGRETRELIESGELMGWDDPRLMTMKALKRRGILPDTIKDLVFDIGFKRDDANIDFTRIANINRTKIDKEVNRYFFVKDPVGVTVKDAPEKDCHLALHPEHPERGTRIMKSKDLFLIAQDDFDSMQDGNLYRLMECLNLVKEGSSFKFDSQDVEAYRKSGAGIMHWLPDDDSILDVEVVMPDATIVSGKGEPTMKTLKVGDIVQLERFGFCRVDALEGSKITFWYTHK